MRQTDALLGSHKDRSPETTIAGIRGMLDAIGIRPTEQQWNVFAERCVSVRLTDPAFPPAGVNGKGVNRSLALASAYGEFVERLQNGVLYENEYGLMPDGGYFTPDARPCATEDLLPVMRRVCPPTMDTSDDAVFALLGDRTISVPFWNVQTRAVVHLPWDAVRLGCGTNGMCAGNTPEEALLQGLCEICERHAVREIYRRTPSLPTIPLSAVAAYPIHGVLEQIVTAGYALIIKDCSLGGSVPVLALVMLNKNRTRYRAAFGSDPLLEVALQRCMTEVVQGIASGQIERHMMPLHLSTDLPTSQDNRYAQGRASLDYEMRRQMMSGSGQLPSAIFLSQEHGRGRRAFQRRFVSHAHSLRWLVARILSRGFPIYIRDTSFLGFPSYQIYVPGMSEGLFIDEELARNAGQRLRKVRHCLLDLPGAATKSLRECMSLVRTIAAHPYYSAWLWHEKDSDWMTWLSGITLRSGTDFRSYVEMLFAAMCNRAGDYRQASVELGNLLAREGSVAELESPPYTLGCMTYFRLRAENGDEPLIRRSISAICGSEIARMVVKDLRNPEDAFRYMKLPRCGCCPQCPVRRQCYYPRWKEIGRAFARAARVPPAHEIAAVFA